MQHHLLNYPNLDVRAGSVFDLVLNHTVPPIHESNSSQNVWATVDGVRLGSLLLLSGSIRFPLIHWQTRANLSNALKSSCALAPSCLGRFTLVR